jgi:hypothetical protein
MVRASAKLLARIVAMICGYLAVPNAIAALVLLVKREPWGIYPAGLVVLFAAVARRAVRFANGRAG